MWTSSYVLHYSTKSRSEARNSATPRAKSRLKHVWWLTLNRRKWDVKPNAWLRPWKKEKFLELGADWKTVKIMQRHFSLKHAWQSQYTGTSARPTCSTRFFAKWLVCSNRASRSFASHASSILFLILFFYSSIMSVIAIALIHFILTKTKFSEVVRFALTVIYFLLVRLGRTSHTKLGSQKRVINIVSNPLTSRSKFKTLLLSKYTLHFSSFGYVYE